MILKLADQLSQNTGMQDRLQSAVQESAKPRIAFCQWMGLEMSKLDEELWTGFMHEAFDLVTAAPDPAAGTSSSSSWLCSHHQCSHSRINLLCVPGVHLHCRHPHSGIS